MKRYKTVLTIAGSDCSGGAGIQADIKTISATGAYAASVITVITAQNTQGVQAITPLAAETVDQQLNSIFSDIHIDAVKIGVLHEAEIIDVVIAALKKFKPPQVIIDPVMIATSGDSLLPKTVIDYLKTYLLPQATLITPNLQEAACLANMKIKTKATMITAAKKLSENLNCHVLVKGGHAAHSEANDVLLQTEQPDDPIWFSKPWVTTHNLHGTGCTLSAAIASYVAQGMSLINAITAAKAYLTKALRAGAQVQLGQGSGPVNHFFMFT